MEGEKGVEDRRRRENMGRGIGEVDERGRDRRRREEAEEVEKGMGRCRSIH